MQQKGQFKKQMDRKERKEFRGEGHQGMMYLDGASLHCLQILCRILCRWLKNITASLACVPFLTSSRFSTLLWQCWQCKMDMCGCPSTPITAPGAAVRVCQEKGRYFSCWCVKVILRCYKQFRGAVTVRFLRNKAGVQLWWLVVPVKLNYWEMGELWLAVLISITHD